MGETKNLTKLTTSAMNLKIFAKKVLGVMLGYPVTNQILPKLKFDIRNAKREVVGKSVTNLHEDDGRNHFLKLLGKIKNISAHFPEGKNFLVVTENVTTKKRRRLVERRPIHRLYNQILD